MRTKCNCERWKVIEELEEAAYCPWCGNALVLDAEIIIQDTFPEVKVTTACRTYWTNDSKEFDGYDMEKLPIDSINWIAYWYVPEAYDGRGYCLMAFKNDTYTIWDCGHCSCYGPLEHFEYSTCKPLYSLEEIESLCDKDLNGNPMEDGWDREALHGMWAAYKMARKDREQFTWEVQNQ